MQQEKPLSELIRDLINGSYALFQKEIKLARTEASHNARSIGRQVAASMTFAIIAWLGIQALLAFSIIGLGKLLDGKFWLSSLIVGLIFLVPGIFLTIRSIKKIGHDASLPASRESITEDQELMSKKIHNITEAAKKRI